LIHFVCLFALDSASEQTIQSGFLKICDFVAIVFTLHGHIIAVCHQQHIKELLRFQDKMPF